MASPNQTYDNVAELLRNLPQRISDVVSGWAESSPDQLALVDSGGLCTYRQLAESVAATRTWLLDAGVRPGDRVMMVSENCRPFVATLLALAALDAWAVLVNARLSASEVDAISKHCGARRVLYTTSVSPQAREHAKRHGASVHDLPGLGQVMLGPLNPEVQPEASEAQIPDRVAALIYTSGTTGLPKGVMLTHRNLLFVAAVSARIRSLTPEDRLYGVLPMSHAVGLSVVLLGSLISGATLFLSHRFDPVALLTALEKERLTVVLGTPAMFSLLLDYAKLKGWKSLRFPLLRILSSSGAPLQPAVKSQVESLFGMALHNGYGVTECSPNISQAVVGEVRTDTSVGRVLPGVEIRLLSDQGQEVAEGEVGELRVRGPNVMKGYYHAPEETAAAIDAEGWFNTRDLARLENGNLFIVGRTKELIVRFGLNVYPAEVEAVLNAYPGVARSAVIGRSVEGTKGDEEVIAFVQSAPGHSLAESELAQHAAQNLAPYKRPSQILLVPTMPLTATGKVIKGELAKLVENPNPH
ncbi:MAG TPA: class I adenylate-forming enzyme family protein [Terriglobales bacterium]|nr:class I adenylate-forming enzyme family protein [Terriglobales bacterium]